MDLTCLIVILALKNLNNDTVDYFKVFYFKVYLLPALHTLYLIFGVVTILLCWQIIKNYNYALE